MEAVQQYGLKRRNLHKFMKQVDRFYEKVVTDKEYKSELAIKYQKRFAKYRDSLFTFLQYDGVPWHNNTAERALRHLAKQQQVSLAFHEQVTHDYLRLLGIRQTLRECFLSGRIRLENDQIQPNLPDRPQVYRMAVD